MDEHAFALSRGDLRDAICLRYGWKPPHLPSHCSDGEPFTVEHALSCSRGGHVSLHHNEVRDLLTDLLSDTCKNVTAEPHLPRATPSKKKKEREREREKKHVEIVLNELKRDPYEDADVEVDGRFNSRLSWQDHNDHVYTDCARKIGILRRLQRKLRSRALRKILIGAIRPRLEYACPVWSGGNTSKLVKLQELFCRRHQIVLPQLQQRFDYHTLVLFFKIKSNLAPPYLTELLPQLSSHCGYNFRKNLYPVPAVKKSSTFTSFFPRSIILWNSLPSNIQSSTSLPKFKAVLKAYFKV